jgi:alpha-tubulin suppressor-like RCC1 family protein
LADKEIMGIGRKWVSRFAVFFIALGIFTLPSPPAQGAISIVDSVSSGYDYACALTSTDDAYCWGRNNWGQLGNNSTTDTNTPVLVTGGHKWASIDAGRDSACGITLDGDAYCWGRGQAGQLGDGNNSDSGVPLLVDGGHEWTSISVGGYFACGITAMDVYCWGNNPFGQVGDNSTTQRFQPVAINGGGDWVSVSAGYDSACGIKVGGSGWCWGRNIDGELGDGTTTESHVPVAISGGHTFSSLQAGEHLACGVSATVGYCWGFNGYGELGNGGGPAEDSPVVVDGSISWTVISPGGGATCGYSTTNTAYCWGAGGLGALGHGATSSHASPLAVAGSVSVATLSMGGAGACVRTTTSQAFCWGWNAYGNVGDGTNTNRTYAVPVLDLSALMEETTVSVNVLPAFTFTLANRATACNGESDFNASAGTATSVALGGLAAASNVSGAQNLTVAGNSGNGFMVYLRGTQTSENLRSTGHNWTDVAGTYASPAALGTGERFGYTYLDSTAPSAVTDPASATFIALDDTDRAVMGTNSASSGTGCVSFDAQTSATTPAGSYSATIIYTAIPNF